jgi:PST family polysaccharide transporter
MITAFKNKFFHLKEFSKKKEVKKITSNIKWMSFEKIFRLFLSVFVSAWVARYLGPEKFGLMNYALAFVALFQAFSVLGLNEIVVRNIVNQKSDKNEILGTAFILKFLGSLLLLAFSSILIIFIRPENQLLQGLVLIVALGYIFKSFDTIDLWFKSQLQSKYTTIAKNSAFFISSGFKIFLILINAPLVGFVWAFTIDFILAGLLLFFIYQKKNKDIFKWRFRFLEAKGLLRDCWPLILSGIAVMIYMKIDQVMIGKMLNDSEVGIYSAAVKISEAWYFIPTAIATSVFPAIIKSKQKSKQLYLKRMQKLYDFSTWSSIGFALLITFFSGIIINVLYGDEYARAASVLSVHIWAGVFVFMGSIASKWVINENYTKNALLRTLIASLINIFLNVMLISVLGILGAALSTLISYGFVNFFSLFFFKKTRECFYLELKSFNLLRLFNVK